MLNRLVCFFKEHDYYFEYHVCIPLDGKVLVSKRCYRCRKYKQEILK